MKLTKQIRGEILRSIMADVPNPNYKGQAFKIVRDDSIKSLPGLIYEPIKQDNSLLSEITQKHVWISGWSIPSFGSDYRPSSSIIDKVTQLSSDAEEWGDSIHSTRRSIETALDKSTTTDQFLKLFPEFECYIPKSQSEILKNLPVTDTMANLMKLKWKPKNER